MKEKTATAVVPAQETAPIKLLPPIGLIDRMQELYNLIARRAFEIFEARGRAEGHDLEDWFGAGAELLHPLHVDIAESDDAVTVHVEVSGFSARELEVFPEPHRLMIYGERETSEDRKAKSTTYRERCSNQISRVIHLPPEVDSS